jgi:hypothetical protein
MAGIVSTFSLWVHLIRIHDIIPVLKVTEIKFKTAPLVGTFHYYLTYMYNILTLCEHVSRHIYISTKFWPDWSSNVATISWKTN